MRGCWLPAALAAAALALSMLPPAAHSQPRAGKLPRIGILGMDSKMQARNIAGFVEGMRELGYEDGKTVVFDYRFAEGRFERLPELAAELVALRPDVLVTAAPPAVRAARQATSTIPIVMSAHDPVGMGFAASLARPGGNITGVAFQDYELSTKRMDVIRAIVPNLTRLAVIWNQEGGGTGAVRAVEAAAGPLGIRLLTIEVKSREDIAKAVQSAKAWNAQGVMQLASPFITLNRATLIEGLSRERLPAVCEMRMYVAEGCLTTYSASLPGMFRSMAVFVDRILRGAKPGDLPIEQPRDFELVINRRTAQELGLALPSTLLLQATEVIN